VRGLKRAMLEAAYGAAAQPDGVWLAAAAASLPAGTERVMAAARALFVEGFAHSAGLLYAAVMAAACGLPAPAADASVESVVEAAAAAMCAAPPSADDTAAARAALNFAQCCLRRATQWSVAVASCDAALAALPTAAGAGADATALLRCKAHYRRALALLELRRFADADASLAAAAAVLAASERVVLAARLAAAAAAAGDGSGGGDSNGGGSTTGALARDIASLARDVRAATARVRYLRATAFDGAPSSHLLSA